jgi:hypothetical protein
MAPRQMSSDPDRFPIEAEIVPLVFAFHTLGVCRPCWSCEGHLDSTGGILRPPQVWFYSDTVFYPRLVEEHLAALRIKRRIENDWRVSVTVAEVDNPSTTFSLAPRAPETDTAEGLASLRRDAATIADGLFEGVRAAARTFLRSIENRLHTA